MDLVDEEDVAVLQVREDGGEVAGTFDGGAAGSADGGVHLGREDVRERRLAQPRRSVEEVVVERFPSLLRRLDGDEEDILQALLAGEFAEPLRPQRLLRLELVLIQNGPVDLAFLRAPWRKSTLTGRMFEG